MRTARVIAPEQQEIVGVPRQDPRPGEVRLRVAAAGGVSQ